MQYEYQFDPAYLEIFPSEIFSDNSVVFHGTNEYHSLNIEKNGFVVNTSAYNLEQAQKLVELLEHPDVSKYDVKKGFFQWTTAHGARHYMESIEKNSFRLSFSALSSACIAFTEGPRKGGQAFADIRQAREIISRAMIEHKNSIVIPPEINDLFQQLNHIDQSRNVIYAIRLPKDLDGITCENNVIYSKKSISADNIVGKVIIPDEEGLRLSAIKASINQKLKEKLFHNAGLAIRLHRNEQHGG